MYLIEVLQNLSLPAMLIAVLAMSAFVAWLVLGATRLAVPLAGFDPALPLPIKDTMIGATSAMFALTLGFSAVGIWNDTVQARAAVQREANALQNVLALANGLPAELKRETRDSVMLYVTRVIEIEWPAMARQVDSDDAVFSQADRVLVHLIDHLSAVTAQGNVPTALAAMLGQLFEARSARLARLALSDGGVTAAQWLALILLALCAFIAVAVVHNHHLGIQILSMNLYGLAAAAAFFVILAHDRPFIGAISVQPTPLEALSSRATAELPPALAGAGRQ